MGVPVAGREAGGGIDGGFPDNTANFFVDLLIARLQGVRDIFSRKQSVEIKRARNKLYTNTTTRIQKNP